MALREQRVDGIKFLGRQQFGRNFATPSSFPTRSATDRESPVRRTVFRPTDFSAAIAFFDSDRSVSLILKVTRNWPRRDTPISPSALSSPPVLWLLDVDGKRYRMRCRTQGERDACVRIKTHGRPGIVNATAAPSAAAGRKREEGSKYDRAEYEL